MNILTTYMTHLLPDERTRHVVMWWLARVVQCPQEFIGWAPVLCENGDRNIGAIDDILRKMLPETFAARTNHYKPVQWPTRQEEGLNLRAWYVTTRSWPDRITKEFLEQRINTIFLWERKQLCFPPLRNLFFTNVHSVPRHIDNQMISSPKEVLRELLEYDASEDMLLPPQLVQDEVLAESLPDYVLTLKEATEQEGLGMRGGLVSTVQVTKVLKGAGPRKVGNALALLGYVKLGQLSFTSIIDDGKRPYIYIYILSRKPI